MLKQLGTGLGCADFFRDIDAVHIAVDAGGRNAGLLHGSSTVGDDGKRCHLAQFLKRSQRAGQQVGVGGEQLLIAVVHGLALAVIRQLHSLHKAAEPHLKQLLLVHLPLGQCVPQLPVYLMVNGAGVLIVGQLILCQHVGQSLTLCSIKVKKRIVDVQQDTSVNCHILTSVGVSR